MSDFGIHQNIVGQTKTVLICSETDKPVAFVTNLKATWSVSDSSRRVQFVGPLSFDRQVQRHVGETILPILDDICRGLEIPLGSYQLSGSNLGAASVRDAGVDVSGYSADIPIFLSLLSARLNAPLPQDFVSTGHIASRVGDVRLVKNLKVKLQSSIQFDGITTFLHPELRTDLSLPVLLGEEVVDVQKNINENSDRIRCLSVEDVAAVINIIWSEEDRLLAALCQGIDYEQCSLPEGDDCVSIIVRAFFGRVENRFYEVIREGVQEGKTHYRLLNAWVDAHVRWKRYPKRMGNRLSALLKSLPNFLRNHRLKRPLLSVKRCMHLSMIAREQEFSDAFLLYESIHGSVHSHRQPLTSHNQKHHKESNLLRLVMAEISAQHLTQVIGLPIDEARSSYVMESVLVLNGAQLQDVVCAFYTHLRMNGHKDIGSVEGPVPLIEAQRLLEETFAQEGGFDAALAEARTGIHGGLRMILDRLVDHYKRRMKEAYVSYVLKSALDAFDWEGKIAFMRLFFDQCSDAIPEELRQEDPSRYARHWDFIVQNYVHSLDKMQSLIRTF